MRKRKNNQRNRGELLRLKAKTNEIKNKNDREDK